MSCSALALRKATPWLLARFSNFERPEHAPRSPAWTHTCAVVYGRCPCVPRNRERENRPVTGREIFCIPKKKPFYTCYVGRGSIMLLYILMYMLC